MKRVNIAIKEETHVRAKIISALTNKTLSDYLQKAVEDAIEKDRDVMKGINDDVAAVGLQ